MAPTAAAAATLRPIVISGPSGAGKSTLLKRLFDENPAVFGFSVSHTTRKPRAGEENGTAYHFVSRDEFQDLISKRGFIEHAEFSGNCYGTSIAAVEDVAKAGRRCVLDIDSQGVRSLKSLPRGSPAAELNPVFVFLSPPSISALRERLGGRGSENEESLAARLAASKAEIAYAREPGIYDVVIINDTVDEAYEKLRAVAVEGKMDVGDRVPSLDS